MNSNFDEMVLSKNNHIRRTFSETAKFIFSMREITQANIESFHYIDIYKRIHKNFDITETFDKFLIIQKRLSNIYNNADKLKPEILQKFKNIDFVLSDKNLRKNIFPLYNNNYRSSIAILVKICINNPQLINEYIELMKTNDPRLKYGGRGIIYNIILRFFMEKKYFNKIGVIKFKDRNTELVSVSRLILTFLSNCTSTSCISKGVEINELFEAFINVLDLKKIIKSIWGMYELYGTEWNHLITFSYIPDVKISVIEEDLIHYTENNKKHEYTALRYTCGGKVFLELITTHFEFFAIRLASEDCFYDPLFSSKNENNINGKYGFENIIEEVLREVRLCCDALEKFNSKIMEQKQLDKEEYYKSNYVCLFKKEDGRTFREYHSERIINMHIGYLDSYRGYLLHKKKQNDEDYFSEEEKQKINMKLTKYIKAYTNIVEHRSLLISIKTKKTLIPYYKEQIKKIELKNYTDYDTKINNDV